MERIAPDTLLGRVLEWCSTKQATDLHAQADHAYTYRVEGELRRIPPEQFPAPTNDAIVCQRLIPGTGNRRIPCLEIMRRNAGALEAIGRNDLPMLAGIIQASRSEGMHSFDQYLLELLRGGYVTEETARHFASNWNKLEMEMRGYSAPEPGILRPDAQS
jgi:Tfp pilus assembly pilus retraction ATPase PilT